MMETVLESWRAEHRDELAVIYDRLGEILSAPDRAMRSRRSQASSASVRDKANARRPVTRSYST